ncbi:uncharacterized protein Pyn_38278 [Prunus yedoensis var. nudiflora]|uniref:Uncharacterized protein n=1 Tax=Prunus yedoensis var. nudiflora TaxID=2094558 RepID=A0A314ZU59_PRUYE|nr:uncharacterized protein Pyn_38278 [Prunus yedoensis var. nudiflora]
MCLLLSFLQLWKLAIESMKESILQDSQTSFTGRLSLHIEKMVIPILSTNDRDYPAYTRGARHDLPPATTSATAGDAYARDPYYGYSYYGSSLDPYLAPQRRENHLIETDPVRRETDRVERLYSTHAVGGRRENYLIETDPVLRR